MKNKPEADWHSLLLAKSPKWLAALDHPRVSEDHPYLHWESVAKLTPPKDLKRRHWWALIKLRRSIRFQTIKVTPNCTLQYFMTSEMFASLYCLDRELGPHGNFAQRHLASHRTDCLSREALTAGGSQELPPNIPDWLWSETKPLLPAQIKCWSAYQVLRHLIQMAHEPLTPSLIIGLCSQLGNETPIKPNKSDLKALCAFANTTEVSGFLHPWIRGVAIQFWFGQAARHLGAAAASVGHALTYWHAVRNGWPGYQLLVLSQADSQTTKRQNRAMAHTVSDDFDLNYVLLQRLEAVQEAFERAKQFVANSRAAQHASLPDELPTNLNARQRITLANAYRSPQTTITISAHQHLHGIAYQTARTDLLGLAQQGILTCTQTGKRFTFLLAMP